MAIVNGSLIVFAKMAAATAPPQSPVSGFDGHIGRGAKFGRLRNA
jgi:hypothetical protein